MSNTPANANLEQTASEQSEIDKLECTPAGDSENQKDGQDGLVRPSNLRVRAPCRVCFDLDLPDGYVGSEEDQEAYRASAIDRIGVDPIFYSGKLLIPIVELEATAEAGCPSCQVLRGVWRRMQQREPMNDPKSFDITARKSRTSHRSFSIIIESGGMQLGSCFHRVIGKTQPRPSSCYLSQPPPRAPVPNSAIETQDWMVVIALIYSLTQGDESSSSLSKRLLPLKWSASQPTLSYIKEFVGPRLTNCLSSHPECAVRIIAGFLPTRLIAVSGDERSSLKPFLVETAISHPKTANNDTRYIALSHCWGLLQPIVTNKNNYKSHLKEIPWAELTKTFQEAMLVTWCLGVRLLWIDSLCIIQDDDEDWAREASKMAEIYQNSLLTIAATSARNGSQGLFMDRPDVEKAQTPGGELSVLYRPVVNHARYRQLKGTGRMSVPLLQRGWTFQEQILSTRILHFTQEELLWECRSEIFCECTPEAADCLWDSRKSVDRTTPGVKQAFDFTQQVQMSDWYKIVEIYTTRDLTYSRDRLPALSGIADAFQKSLRDPGRYLAGLWENDLIEGLLWVTYDSNPKRARQRSHRSSPPSWSWASLEPTNPTVQIRKLTRERGTPIADVMDVSCTQSTVDDKGMVSGGKLTLRGKLIPLTLQYPDIPKREDEEFYPVLPTDRYTLHPKDGYKRGLFDASQSQSLGRRKLRDVFWPDVPPNFPSENLPSGSVLYFLPLTKQSETLYVKVGQKIEGHCPNGLYLRQSSECSGISKGETVDTSSSPWFTRVGCGRPKFLQPTVENPDPYSRLGEEWDRIVTVV